MELVINKCYGGFGLSKKAIARLAELNGKTAYFFKYISNRGEYNPVGVNEEWRLLFTAFFIPNPHA